MTSDNTNHDTEIREGQDHEADEVPTLGEIRLQRFARLLFGLGVPVVTVIGSYRIAESGGDPFEVMTTIIAIATCALVCAYAGVRAAQLQTEYDEANASPDHR